MIQRGMGSYSAKLQKRNNALRQEASSSTTTTTKAPPDGAEPWPQRRAASHGVLSTQQATLSILTNINNSEHKCERLRVCDDPGRSNRHGRCEDTQREARACRGAGGAAPSRGRLQGPGTAGARPAVGAGSLATAGVATTQPAHNTHFVLCGLF
ncbi:hypothetical protein E2C01_008630 [Portunus trituberculatus]|uniref:Uncharacterized protein n=1 Tax=Portunus trituberculatus TaxID=210409 RepID=A0A5B7D1B6_PORTR|nr:hypothetical protein [Portunus trituberculatus]